MSMAYFFAPPPAWHGATIDLDGGETRHLHVLRLKAGEEIRVMDGASRTASCRLRELSRHRAIAEIGESEVAPRDKALAIMALAMSKATRRGFFMEKAVELGCAAVWIWQGENSQGKIPAGFAESVRGQMIAGAKQCANPWLPEVRTFANAAEMIGEAARADYKILPYEQQKGQPLLEYSMLGRPGTTVYVIGPEGGFSPAEIELMAAAGFVAVSLGQRVLRCETAAVLCLGLHYRASQAIAR